MEKNYKLIDDGESSYKIDWLGKKLPMTNMQNFLKAYKNMKFISTCGKSSQYVECAKDFKKVIKKIFGEEYNVELSIGHFYFYGFISKDDKYCYFNVGDLRTDCLGKNPFDNILCRSAKNNEDFSGGHNNFCSCEEFEMCVKKLLERGF